MTDSPAIPPPAPLVLGRSYRDSLTGFAGIATSRTTYLYGCVRVSLEAPGKDGGPPEEVYFDEQRLVSDGDAIQLLGPGGAVLAEVAGNEDGHGWTITAHGGTATRRASDVAAALAEAGIPNQPLTDSSGAVLDPIPPAGAPVSTDATTGGSRSRPPRTGLR